MRYNDTVLRMKQIIDQGALGKLVTLNCSFFYNGMQTKRTWLWDKDIAGGGPVMDLGVHCLDNIRFLSGKEVISHKSTLDYPKDKPDNGVELKASIDLQLEGGVLGHISCGFEGNYFTSLEVIGEKGILHADMFNLIESEIELRRFTNRELETELILNGNCYAKEIDDFALSVLQDRESPIPGSEGLINQQTLDQILRSG